MSELVEQILLFASTDDCRLPNTVEALSISAIIDSSLSKMDARIRDAGFSVVREIEPNLPSVLGNVMAISHCLNCLIDNAVKYSGESRSIEVRALAAPGEDRTVQELRICVTDHGIGIDSAEMSRIFDPFYRSPRVQSAGIHGAGLGLSLTKRFAESIGGKLSVKSEPGHGSVFTLHLQFARDVTETGDDKPVDLQTEALHG